MKQPRVLLITTAAKTRTAMVGTALLTRDLNALHDGIAYSYVLAQDLIFRVDDAGIHVYLDDGTELRDACDVLYLRNMRQFSDYVAALHIYCKNFGIHLINNLAVDSACVGKVSQGFALCSAGIPTPNLISSPSNSTLRRYLQATQPYPFPYIIKHAHGIMGHDNHLVSNQDEMKAVLRQAKQGFVVQPYFTNHGELRILTFGDSLEPLVFKKTAQGNTHLNNTSQGGAIEPLTSKDVPADIMEAALKASNLTGYDIGGVDVLLGTDGGWVILEVNYTPKLAGGAMYDEKVTKFSGYMRQLTGESA